MQNEFDGYSLEAQMDKEEPGEGKEREEQELVLAAGPADTDREDLPGSEEEAGEREPDPQEEKPEGQDAGLERERGGQVREEDTEAEQAASVSEETDPSQPEILIDVEEEEKNAELAQRKARLDKERLDCSRRLQQYYQDQYARERYYREQDLHPTAHSLDGLTVYEDESVVSGIAGHDHARLSTGKQVQAADAALIRSRESRSRSWKEQNAAAGIEEPEGHAAGNAAAKPKSAAEKTLSIKNASKKKVSGRNFLRGDELAEEAAGKGSGRPMAGFGADSRYILTETRTAEPGSVSSISYPSKGILEQGEQAAGIETASAMASGVSGDHGKQEPAATNGIGRSLLPVRRVLRLV